MIDTNLLKLGLSCKCPRCKQGDLYREGFTLTLRHQCANCGLDLNKNDSADGPAVFLIFILGTLVVPLALIVDSMFTPPVWVHALLWTPLVLGATLGALRPLKAYIIALQFRHRPESWL